MTLTKSDIERLEALEKEASSGPWFVRRLDDELCMGAVTVSLSPESGEPQSMRAGTWPSDEIIAAFLVQSPPYAMIKDDRFEENAKLVAEVRNVLPELLAIARSALKI